MALAEPWGVWQEQSWQAQLPLPRGTLDPREGGQSRLGCAGWAQCWCGLRLLVFPVTVVAACQVPEAAPEALVQVGD